MTAEIGVLPFTLDVRLPPESLFQFLVFRDLWQSCSVLLGDEALLTLQSGSSRCSSTRAVLKAAAASCQKRGEATEE